MIPHESMTCRFPVGLEEGPSGATLVHSFSLPGCVAGGRDTDEALDAFTNALASWLAFLATCGEPVPSRDVELEVIVEEWVATDARIRHGETNACFECDRQALAEAEASAGVRVLGALRGRLIPRIRRMRDEDLEAFGFPGFTARQILDELARAQWFTLTRLGASPLAAVPEPVVARLDTAMALVVQHLLNLPADARDRAVVMEGEEWTPRKVLRRLLWLEWELGGAVLDALGEPYPARR
jgi:predicted RNase H-like HicB family nuclease